MRTIRNLYMCQLDKTLKAKSKYDRMKSKLLPYEEDVKGWFAAQYKQYNYNHYITELKIVDTNRTNIVFALKFTDTNLNGTVTLPLYKVMSLDITYNDFVVVPYKSKFKNK